MVPLQTSMAPPPPTVAAPPPCEPPKTGCAPPTGAPPCGATGCGTPPPPPPPGVGQDRSRGDGDVVWGPMGGPKPAAATAAGQPSVEDLQRRCANLEAKIDLLVDALNRSRANGPK